MGFAVTCKVFLNTHMRIFLLIFHAYAQYAFSWRCLRLAARSAALVRPCWNADAKRSWRSWETWTKGLINVLQSYYTLVSKILRINRVKWWSRQHYGFVFRMSWIRRGPRHRLSQYKFPCLPSSLATNGEMVIQIMPHDSLTHLFSIHNTPAILNQVFALLGCYAT